MKKLRFRRPSPSMAVALMALLVSLGGTAAADPGGHISALLNGKRIKASTITTKQIKNRSLLNVDFKNGQLPRGAAGPAGSPGPGGAQGPAGPAGASATALWAVVRENGNLARGSGVTSANRVDNSGNNNQYQIVFNRDVRQCSYQATVASPDSINITTFIIPQMITAAGMSSNDNGVAVNVWDPDSQGVGGFNQYVADDFHLAVFC